MQPVSYFAQRVSKPEWTGLGFWRSSMERFDAEVRPDLSNAPELLREVPLAIFAAALMWPEKYFPRAHVYLPVPPSNEVQRSWTGSSGELLLETSVAFVQQQLALFSTSGAPLGAGTRLLDFGMGWGRIARLWLKYRFFVKKRGVEAG